MSCVQNDRQRKQIIKKGNVLQTQKHSHRLTHSIKNSSFKKDVHRISPVTFYMEKGSMTVEAALVLPLFLVGVLTILSLINMIKTTMEMEMKLHKTAREAAVYGYAADKITGGREGDWIRLKLVYPISPDVKGIGFHTLLVETHCNVHIFNGYDATKGDSIGKSEEYVYITQEGNVYHKKRECKYINVSIQAIAGKEAALKRNEDGKKFYPCPKCGNISRSELKKSIVFITDYGVKYHTSLRCPDLKRSVQTIPLSEVGGRPPCSGCVE